MASRSPFPITNFTFSNGEPLADGYVLVSISEDAQVTSASAQVCAGMTLTLTLDSNGNVLGSPTLWPNASLSPSNTVYLYSAYTQAGELVAGPNSITI